MGYHATADPVTYNSIVYTLSYRVIFGFAGIGNFNQIFELFMGLAPKIGINLAVQSGLLGSSATRSLSCSWAWPLRSVSTSLFKAAYLEALQPNLTALRRLSCLINSASKVPLDSHEELSHILMH